MKKILIRGTNWIGDAVLTTPAITALKRHTGAHLILLVRPHIAELLAGNPYIDKFVIYDDRGAHRGVRGRLRLAEELKKEGCDMALLFQNAFDAALVAFLARIPVRYGYPTDGRRFLLTWQVPLSKEIRARHQVEYYLRLLEPLGIHETKGELLLVTSSQEDMGARERVASLGVREGRPLVGIAPGATYGSAKRWYPERYASVADRLVEKEGAEILIFGTAEESHLGEEIVTRMKKRGILLCGKTTVRELMSMIKQCHLFLTNDSGSMHIAAAFGVPVVALFGPTDPRATSPVGPGHVIIRREEVPCSPCHLRKCPIDHICMKWIGIDQVYEAAHTQLAGWRKA